MWLGETTPSHGRVLKSYSRTFPGQFQLFFISEVFLLHLFSICFPHHWFSLSFPGCVGTLTRCEQIVRLAPCLRLSTFLMITHCALSPLFSHSSPTRMFLSIRDSELALGVSECDWSVCPVIHWQPVQCIFSALYEPWHKVGKISDGWMVDITLGFLPGRFAH